MFHRLSRNPRIHGSRSVVKYRNFAENEKKRETRRISCSQQLRSPRAACYISPQLCHCAFYFRCVLCQSVSSCNIWKEIFKKPESTWRDVSLSTKEFSCLDRDRWLALFFVVCLCQSIVSAVLGVRTAKANNKKSPRNSFLTTVCLTRTVMEFSAAYIEIDDSFGRYFMRRCVRLRVSPHIIALNGERW